MQNSEEYFELTYDKNYSNILELSDAKLRTEDGREFNVHRCILAKSSNYFYALFCGIGKGRRDILIPDIRGGVLSNILLYIYTDKIYMNEENVCDLMLAADYLLLDSLILKIKMQISEKLSIKNCLSIFSASLQINQIDVLRESYRFIQTHFEAVVLVEDSALGQLPIEALKQFLCDKNLCVRNEKTIWLAVVNWVQTDTKNRQLWVSDLLMYLTFCNVDEQLATEILEHNIVAKNPSCQKIEELKLCSFASNLDVLLTYFQDNLKPILPLYNQRMPMTLHFIAHYCVYKQTDGIQIYVTYDENIDLWRKVMEVDMCPEFLMSIGHNIYMFRTSDNRNFRYNLVEKQWTEMSSFNEERYYCGVVKLHGFIYVLGGISIHTGEEMNYVEVYDPDTDVWNDASPMVPVTSFGAVALNEYIYVVGNKPSVLGFEMITQVYDPETDSWHLLTSPSIFRFNFALAAYHGKLFVIGGTDEDEYLISVEVYDPVRQQWTSQALLPYLFYLPKAIILNDQLIVYDNHLEDRSYLKTNPPVQWNHVEKRWKPFDDSSSLVHLHKYCFFNPDSNECLERISKENKDPRAEFTKSPFN